MTFQIFWCRHCNAPPEVHGEHPSNPELRNYWLDEDGDDDVPEEGFAYTLKTCPGFEPKAGAARAGQLLEMLAPPRQKGRGRSVRQEPPVFNSALSLFDLYRMGK